MSDNIYRLKVDSKEYDSNLKSATDGLSRFMQKIHDGTVDVRSIDKETLAYVQALGQMEM